jgi:hypothetical protein
MTFQYGCGLALQRWVIKLNWHKRGFDMRRFRLIVLLALIGITTIASAKSNEESYYCVGEASGGIFYDAKAKTWHGTVFKADQKFVLNVKQVDSKYEGSNFIETLTLTITLAGSNYAAQCFDTTKSPKEAAIVVLFESVRCTANATEYIFNRSNNRYLAVYAIGYVSGRDDNENTPSMTGGTCTKIQ